MSNRDKFQLIVTTGVVDANGEWYDAFAPRSERKLPLSSRYLPCGTSMTGWSGSSRVCFRFAA